MLRSMSAPQRSASCSRADTDGVRKQVVRDGLHEYVFDEVE
nr:hypothetical protein WG33_0095 [uncultured bacterium]